MPHRNQRLRVAVHAILNPNQKQQSLRTYLLRIGLALAILKVVFPDLGLWTQLLLVRETLFFKRKQIIGLSLNGKPQNAWFPLASLET